MEQVKLEINVRTKRLESGLETRTELSIDSSVADESLLKKTAELAGLIHSKVQAYHIERLKNYEIEYRR